MENHAYRKEVLNRETLSSPTSLRSEMALKVDDYKKKLTKKIRKVPSDHLSARWRSSRSPSSDSFLYRGLAGGTRKWSRYVSRLRHLENSLLEKLDVTDDPQAALGHDPC